MTEREVAARSPARGWCLPEEVKEDEEEKPTVMGGGVERVSRALLGCISNNWCMDTQPDPHHWISR